MLENWPKPGEIAIVLKEVESGKIVGPSAPFLPATRAIYATRVDGEWREVPGEIASRWVQ